MEVTSPGGAVCDDLTYSELYNELPQDVKKAIKIGGRAAASVAQTMALVVLNCACAAAYCLLLGWICLFWLTTHLLLLTAAVLRRVYDVPNASPLATVPQADEAAHKVTAAYHGEDGAGTSGNSVRHGESNDSSGNAFADMNAGEFHAKGSIPSAFNSTDLDSFEQHLDSPLTSHRPRSSATLERDDTLPAREALAARITGRHDDITNRILLQEAEMEAEIAAVRLQQEVKADHGMTRPLSEKNREPSTVDAVAQDPQTVFDDNSAHSSELNDVPSGSDTPLQAAISKQEAEARQKAAKQTTFVEKLKSGNLAASEITSSQGVTNESNTSHIRPSVADATNIASPSTTSAQAFSREQLAEAASFATGATRSKSSRKSTARVSRLPNSARGKPTHIPLLNATTVAKAIAVQAPYRSRLPQHQDHQAEQTTDNIIEPSHDEGITGSSIAPSGFLPPHLRKAREARASRSTDGTTPTRPPPAPTTISYTHSPTSQGVDDGKATEAHTSPKEEGGERSAVAMDSTSKSGLEDHVPPSGRKTNNDSHFHSLLKGLDRFMHAPAATHSQRMPFDGSFKPNAKESKQKGEAVAEDHEDAARLVFTQPRPLDRDHRRSMSIDQLKNFNTPLVRKMAHGLTQEQNLQNSTGGARHVQCARCGRWSSWKWSPQDFGAASHPALCAPCQALQARICHAERVIAGTTTTVDGTIASMDMSPLQNACTRCGHVGHTHAVCQCPPMEMCSYCGYYHLGICVKASNDALVDQFGMSQAGTTAKADRHNNELDASTATHDAAAGHNSASSDDAATTDGHDGSNDQNSATVHQIKPTSDAVNVQGSNASKHTDRPRAVALRTSSVVLEAGEASRHPSIVLTEGTPQVPPIDSTGLHAEFVPSRNNTHIAESDYSSPPFVNANPSSEQQLKQTIDQKKARESAQTCSAYDHNSSHSSDSIAAAYETTVDQMALGGRGVGQQSISQSLSFSNTIQRRSKSPSSSPKRKAAMKQAVEDLNQQAYRKRTSLAALQGSFNHDANAVGRTTNQDEGATPKAAFFQSGYQHPDLVDLDFEVGRESSETPASFSQERRSSSLQPTALPFFASSTRSADGATKSELLPSQVPSDHAGVANSAISFDPLLPGMHALYPGASKYNPSMCGIAEGPPRNPYAQQYSPQYRMFGPQYQGELMGGHSSLSAPRAQHTASLHPAQTWPSWLSPSRVVPIEHTVGVTQPRSVPYDDDFPPLDFKLRAKNSNLKVVGEAFSVHVTSTDADSCVADGDRAEEASSNEYGITGSPGRVNDSARPDSSASFHGILKITGTSSAVKNDDANTRADMVEKYSDETAAEDTSGTADGEEVTKQSLKKKKRAIRKDLLEAWMVREDARTVLYGTWTLDGQKVFEDVTKAYNKKREELMECMASGELPEEDAKSYPYFSTKDRSAPKVRPEGLQSQASKQRRSGDPLPDKEHSEPSKDEPKHQLTAGELQELQNTALDARDRYGEAQSHFKKRPPQGKSKLKDWKHKVDARIELASKRYQKKREELEAAYPEGLLQWLEKELWTH